MNAAMTKKRILIVDDEPGVRTILRRFFEISGFNVVEAADGLEGFETANDVMPDCVILDMEMPVMNGIDLCSYLKRTPRTRHIPVLFLTGEGRMGPTEDALKQGADGYMTKPFDLLRLLKKIETFWAV
jgi:CheY-like chemotaxis protein